MAPKQKTIHQNSQPKTVSTKELITKYCSFQYVKYLLFDPRNIFPVTCVILFLELIINVAVIQRVRYTEIDWKAYMQEVEGVMNGTLDYSLLKGDTGPLVYPAGFVYFFSGLYLLTNRGENIILAQYIFALIYLINLGLVARLHIKAKKIPPYLLILTCLTSYRIHSIYVLRLFNDPVAMLFLYSALNAFLDSKWTLGSVLFSLAVSIKMNILLFAPAILLFYLTSLGLKNTILQLIICASVQLALGLPFLFENPVSYLMGSFDFGRVFLYEWTVNWRFLPEDIFLNKYFHLSLLTLHLLLLVVFYTPSLLFMKTFAKLKRCESDIQDQLKKDTKFNMTSSSQLFLLPVFLANFIGIACSRSLHYQFYVWYFHSLPYVLWCTELSVRSRLVILGVIELCWNTYPSTEISSASLHVCHAVVLYSLYQKLAKTVNHKHE